MKIPLQSRHSRLDDSSQSMIHKPHKKLLPLPTALVLVVIAAMAIYGFRTALAGRPALGRAVLED